MSKMAIPMLKNIAQMNKPLIGCFFKSVNFDQQPGPMMAVAVDEFNMGIWFLKLLVISLRSASIFNIFSTGKNRGEVFRVKRQM